MRSSQTERRRTLCRKPPEDPQCQCIHTVVERPTAGLACSVIQVQGHEVVDPLVRANRDQLPRIVAVVIEAHKVYSPEHVGDIDVVCVPQLALTVQSPSLEDEPERLAIPAQLMLQVLRCQLECTAADSTVAELEGENLAENGVRSMEVETNVAASENEG